jgi:hypothetical protein
MATGNKKIINIDKSILEKAFSISENYRQALTELGLYYCSGSIARVRVAAQLHNIDISHLDIKSVKSTEDAEKDVINKSRKRSVLNKKLRKGEPKDYARFILADSKKNDKKNNRDNNLTVDFIVNKLSYGKCKYCDDTDSKLTLDRIDNSLGHLIDNVEVSCNFCNTIRGNMPYDAWIHIVPSIKSAKNLGLFDFWKPYNRRFG